jgi:protein-tyrosine-phosphatase
MTALKLDENLSDQLLAVAREHGLDAESVRSEQLVGIPETFDLIVEPGRVRIHRSWDEDTF